MKVLFIRLLFICLLSTKALSQVSFTLPASVCINTSISLTANTGTLANPQITWLASPNAVFSNSVSANTNVTFTASGNYTVLVVAISGTALAFTQNTIDVIANPSPTLTASSASVCPLSTFSIMASPLSGANYSFGLPGPVTVANGTSNVLQINPPTVLPAVYEVSVELGGCIGTSTVIVNQLQLNPQIISSSNGVCPGYSATLTAFGMSSYTFSILSPTPALIPNGITQTLAVSPSVVTVYQVLGESMGCTGTASVSIGILAPLTINISATSLTTCIMNNSPKISKLVTLNPMGASNYIWLPPDPFPGPFPTHVKDVRPHVTTCYTVTGTTQVCSGTAAICVTVTPQFTIAVSPATASICLGQTLTLVSGSVGPEAVGPPSAYTYSWTESLSTPPYSMSSYLTPTTAVFPQNNATYTLQAWDTQTCVSIPQVATVEVFPCLNLSEEQNTINHIIVYPNPVFDVCEIRTLGSGFTEVQLFDLNGRLVKSVYSPDGKSTQTFQIDLSDIPSGVYFLKTNAPPAESNFQKLVKL